MSDAEAAAPPTDTELRSVAELAAKQRAAAGRVARLEEELKRAKEHLRLLAEDELPKAMVACGYAPGDKNISVAGLKLALEDKFRCGQLDERNPEGLGWVNENQPDIAKRVLTVTLGRDSEDVAVELIGLLRTHRLGNQLNIAQQCLVPWSTLASFSREQIAHGVDLPLPLLGVTRLLVAKVTAKEWEE